MPATQKYELAVASVNAAELRLGHVRTTGVPVWAALKINDMQKTLRVIESRLKSDAPEVPPVGFEVTEEGRAAMYDGARVCPFCGSQPKIIQYPIGLGDDARTEVEVRCENDTQCAANPVVYGESLHQALARWNARAE